MVETSCDLYITVQSEELSSIIDKYAIHEKGDGRMEYFHDFHTYRFYAIYIDQNELYNAIPSSDWLLTDLPPFYGPGAMLVNPGFQAAIGTTV